MFFHVSLKDIVKIHKKVQNLVFYNYMIILRMFFHKLFFTCYVFEIYKIIFPILLSICKASPNSIYIGNSSGQKYSSKLHLIEDGVQF